MKDLALSPVPVRPRTGSPRRIALMPAYNEDATVVGVLERLEPLVDEIIVVDDGSTDRTREVVFAWSRSRPHVQLICLHRNRGMSAAYYEALREIRRRMALGQLSPDDIVLTVDADGQHEPAEIEALVARLVEGGFDGVIARRDLSTYTRYKRLGNWLVSLWASLWAGHRYYDVESGFRAFRVGALLSALQYYRGYKYSETVEVAVILPRLGYRVSNDLSVPVPIFRSRTRLKDALIDLAAMPVAWWRLVTARNRPRDVPSWSTYVLPTFGVLALLFMTVNLLANALFLGDDSMHNYAHVWYISQQLFDHARIPLRISLLDGGRAVTFPYGLAPYLAAAVLFRPLGDWSVTLMMAVAVVGTVWAAGMARPIMRNPWFVLLFVINPFFIDAVYTFQFASMWSILFFLLFVWAFERQRYLFAAVLLWLTVSSHPIIGGLSAGVYALCLLVLDRPKVRPLALLSIPVAVALVPVLWMMMLTPSIRENSLRTVILSVLDVLPRRGSVVMAPFLFTALAPYLSRFYRPSLAVIAGGAAVGVLLATGPFDFHQGGYYGALHRSTNVYAGFFQSAQFQPGATYRVLEPNEREDGMYRFIQHGAVLSNEFFSESLFRRNWTEPQYACFAAFKAIDYVVVEKAYVHQFHYHEENLLQSLVRSGQAELAYADPGGKFNVYDIRRFAAEQPKPASLRECGVF
jgi:glycosyltransferase involved in cell wall biosynthesis